MTIQEMHIEFNLSMQKIASNVKRKFVPEEIDWIINKQIPRFIDKTIKPDERDRTEGGFQTDGLNLNDIRTLLVFDKVLPVYKTAIANKFVQAELPGNYYAMIANNSGIVRSCNTSIYNSVKSFSTKIQYIYKLKLPLSNQTARPYYRTVSLNIGGTEVATAGQFPVDLQDKNMKFTIENTLWNILMTSDISIVKCYWEQFRNNYQPETFIFVSDTPLVGGIVYTADGVNTAAVLSTLNLFTPGPGDPVYSKANREIRGNRKNEFQDSSFAKSMWQSPIGTIEGNTFKVYHDETFIVNNLSIDYIRKPQLVNLSLGIGSDLPADGNVHQRICDMSVEYVKMAIGDPNYQWKLQDNQLNSK